MGGRSMEAALVEELRAIHQRLGELLKQLDASPVGNSLLTPRFDGGKDGWLEVIDHYKQFHPRAFPRPVETMREVKAIKARFKEGYSIDDLKEAIDGCHRSDFHQGMIDQRKKYDSLELIMRDASKVQWFIEKNRTSANPLPKVSEGIARAHELMMEVDDG